MGGATGGAEMPRKASAIDLAQVTPEVVDDRINANKNRLVTSIIAGQAAVDSGAELVSFDEINPFIAMSGEISKEDLEKALDGDHVICVWENPDSSADYRLCVPNDPDSINTAAAMNRDLLGTTGTFSIMEVEQMTSLKGLQAFYDGSHSAGGSDEFRV